MTLWKRIMRLSLAGKDMLNKSKYNLTFEDKFLKIKIKYFKNIFYAEYWLQKPIMQKKSDGKREDGNHEVDGRNYPKDTTEAIAQGLRKYTAFRTIQEG